MSEKRIFFLAHHQARSNAAKAVAEAPEGWKVTVEPPKRSGEQNALLHALLTEVADHCEWFGRKWDLETWKRLLVSAWCRTHGAAVVIVPALDGQGVDMVPVRTSKLSKAECGDLIEFIHAWRAEHMTKAEAPCTA